MIKITLLYLVYLLITPQLGNKILYTILYQNNKTAIKTLFVYFILCIYVFLHPYSFLLGLRLLVLNTTFNNISDISSPSVLLMEETQVSRENHRPVASH